MDEKIKISFDLDGTLNGTDSKFFQMISHLLYPETNIYILTNREPGTEAEIADELARLNILYHKIKITADKAGFIKADGIQVVFENEDEAFKAVGKDVLVLKVRESLNYDYKTGRWIGSAKTVKMID